MQKIAIGEYTNNYFFFIKLFVKHVNIEKTHRKFDSIVVLFGKSSY